MKIAGGIRYCPSRHRYQAVLYTGRHKVGLFFWKTRGEAQYAWTLAQIIAHEESLNRLPEDKDLDQSTQHKVRELIKVKMTKVLQGEFAESELRQARPQPRPFGRFPKDPNQKRFPNR